MSKLLRFATLLLAVLLLAQPLAALAESAEEKDPITYIAKATTMLKVRRAPDQSSSGNASIPKDSYVYIIDKGAEWCFVRVGSRVEGYVMTKYLTDFQAQEGVAVSDESTEAETASDVPPDDLQPGFTTSRQNFYEGYYAHTVCAAIVYQEPNVNSRQIADIPIYKQVVVSEVSGDWSLVRYKGNVYGYMRNDTLFKWDRIDPYVGEIPGLDVWPYMAFVNQVTTIYDISSNKELKTINPGAAICVGQKDSMGRYPTPYHRTTGYVTEDQIAYLMPVVAWDKAESGDLISVMTTYFGVGKHTLNFQGRNWNIRLASARINGTVLQPGQEYNQNQTIGPYRKSTGYKSAPIMSDDALTGYGGGTCQVNTTFYICTVQIPLLVKHRRVHADVGMEYALQGFDAAVGAGAINLIMENSLPYAIRYQTFISDGVLTVCVFRE